MPVLNLVNLTTDTRGAFEINALNYLEDDSRRGNDISRLLKSVSGIRNYTRVLYAGCGPGTLIENALYETKASTLVGLDVSRKMLELAIGEQFISKQVYPSKFVQADILNLCFKKSSFGLVLCFNNTLGNMPHPYDVSLSHEVRVAALKHIRYVLEPHGLLFLTVYNKALLPLGRFYTDCLAVDETATDIKNGDLVLDFKEGARTIKVYSHWFDLRELESLISNAGFNLVSTELNESRILAVAECV